MNRKVLQKRHSVNICTEIVITFRHIHTYHTYIKHVIGETDKIHSFISFLCNNTHNGHTHKKLGGFLLSMFDRLGLRRRHDTYREHIRRSEAVKKYWDMG